MDIKNYDELLDKAYEKIPEKEGEKEMAGHVKVVGKGEGEKIKHQGKGIEYPGLYIA